MVEVDEMRTCIGSKKTAAGSGLLLTDMGIEDRHHPKVGGSPRRIVSETTAGAKRFVNFVIGDRSNETAKKFWKTINHHEMKYVASDYWKPYESIISKESKIDGAQRSQLPKIILM